MTKFLGRLLALLLMLLGGLCVLQWQREAKLHDSLREVDARLKTEQDTRASLEEKLGSWEKEIHDLNQRLNEQGQKIGSMEQQATAAQQELTTEKKRGDDLAQQLQAAQKSLATAKNIVADGAEKASTRNEAISEQNHTIEKQNEMLKRLSQERDELVAKLNARTEEYNKLVKLQNVGR